jgi:pSer/pThr/pTyr-binding forkhead associated (FHA) protein
VPEATDVPAAREPFVAPAPPAPALPGPASADDHDGLTILSGELASIRQHLPSWAVSQTGDWPSGPVVPSPAPAPGPAGALPVTAGATSAAGTTHAPVPRLALSTGARVPVDGVVLIGRAPQADRAPDGAETRLVTVPSPEQDISRTHAEVRLELGRVLVTDLYSTNGITVAGGGLPPRRITAGEAVAVSEGDVVDLGDGVTFTVEPGA